MPRPGSRQPGDAGVAPTRRNTRDKPLRAARGALGAEVEAPVVQGEGRVVGRGLGRQGVEEGVAIGGGWQASEVGAEDDRLQVGPVGGGVGQDGRGGVEAGFDRDEAGRPEATGGLGGTGEVPGAGPAAEGGGEAGCGGEGVEARPERRDVRSAARGSAPRSARTNATRPSARGTRRSRAAASIAAERSRATIRPRGRRASRSAVGPPVPQPRSATVSSPRSGSRSRTRRPQAPCGLATRW